MKKKLLTLLAVTVLSLSTFGIALAAFQVANLDIDSDSTSINSNQIQDMVAVTFDGPNNDLDCTKYYPKGTILSLKDAPYNRSGDKYVYWSYNNTALNEHITVNSDLTITGSEQSSANNSMFDNGSYTYTEPLNEPSGDKAKAGSTQISTLIQRYDFNKYFYTGEIKTALATSSIEHKLDWGKYKVYYKFTSDRVRFDSSQDNMLNVRATKQTTGVTDFNYSKAIADNSIALDIPSGTGENTSLYKPTTTGNTILTATNPCTIKITLQNDVYLSGKLTPYARLGVTGNVNADGKANGWGQASIQGIIVASYTEIDLNGYDLVVGNGATLDAFGSITDNSNNPNNRKGEVVLESGSTAYATIVIEDVYREDSTPTTYFNNSTPFFLFRCPYLNCTVRIKQGAKFYGKFSMRLGGGTNAGATLDLLIVGNDSSAMIEMTGSDAEIVRTISYSQEMYNKIHTNAKRNLLHQRIKYSISNATVNLNPYDFHFVYSVIDYNYIADKFPFFVPPYLDFEVYNSTVTFSNIYVFLPPTQVYVDRRSTLIFTNTTKKNAPGIEESILGSTISQAAQEYQAVGGLYFADFFYSFKEGKKYFDTTKEGVGDGYGGGSLNDADCQGAFDYFNRTPARLTLDGQIQINQNGTALYHNFAFAGNIDIRDLNMFSEAIKGKPVNLYASVHLQGPNRYLHVNGLTPVMEIKLNIMGLYNSPLISYGNVLTPMRGETNQQNNQLINNQINVSKTRTFDRFSRTITDVETNKTYAFLFNDVIANNYGNNNTTKTDFNGNLYKANDINEVDSLAGDFYEVGVSGNKIITYNNQSYIPYQGAFIKVADLANAFPSDDNVNPKVTASPKKLWGYESGEKFFGEYNASNDTEGVTNFVYNAANSWSLGQKMWSLERAFTFAK